VLVSIISPSKVAKSSPFETDEEKILVRRTLTEDDVIVTDGTQRLVPNQLVSMD
jgi:hypothetical protein